MKQHLLLAIFCLLNAILIAQAPQKKVLLQTHNGEFNNVISADLDNNGIDDFIVTEGYINWFEGTGDTTWGNSHVIAEDGLLNVSDCRVIDVDLDGLVDLFYITGYGVYNFGWLKNPGVVDAEWINNELPGAYYDFIGLFDVDGDSDNDLVYENDGSLLKWRENIDMDFSDIHTIPDALPSLTASSVCDFDQDGDMDWTGYFYDCCIKYFKNNSDGTFTESSVSTDEYENNVYSTDVNGDGYADILITYYYEIDVATFNPLTNTFNTAGYWDDANIDDIQFKDMDNDGDEDWILFDQDGSDIDITWVERTTGEPMSMGDNEFLISDLSSLSPYISLIDIDNDNKCDVWTANGIGVDVYLNQLPAGFASYPISPENTCMRMDISRILDIDDDGDNDLMVASHNGRLGWLKYDIATDSFYSVHYLPNFESSPYPTMMKEMDLDLDGDIDLITSFRSSGGAEQIAYYCLNDGDGNFSIHEFDDIAFNEIWLTDADEDGDEDLVAMQFSSPNYLHLYLNSGDTSLLYNYAEQLTPADTWKTFDMIDFDADGDDDFIGSKISSSQIQQITNISGGTFSAPVLFYPTPCGAVGALYTDDFDMDADVDYMYVCMATENVTLATNDLGTFTYTSIGDFSVDAISGPSYIETRDINGDNIPDLINSQFSGSTEIKLSTGPGTFTLEYANIYDDFGQFGYFDDNTLVDFVGASDFEFFVQYNAIFAAPVYTISEPTATYLEENGASDGVTITFTEIPQVELRIDFYPSGSIDAGMGEGMPIQLIFSPDETALMPQTVSWAVPDDAIIEDLAYNSVLILNDPISWGIYDGSINETHSYLITDNDAGLFLSSELTTLVEGVTFATLSGHINIIPTSETIINIIPDEHINAGEGTGLIKTVTMPSGIDGVNDFTFILSVENDFIYEPSLTEEINFDLNSADLALDELVPSPISVIINDNDYATISTAFPASLITEEIEPFTIGFNLSSAPIADVIIHAIPDAQFDLGAGTGVPVSMTFIADGGLPVYQNFNGTAVEDAVYEGIHSGAIYFTVESADPYYADLLIDDLFINIMDNPAVEGVNVSFSNTEYYLEGTLEIPAELSLLSIPDEEVIIYATPDAQLDLGSGPGNAIYFFFNTTAEAYDAQLINISIVDDLIMEGDHTGIISFIVESDDILYSDLSIPNIIVNITDNDNVVAIENGDDDLIVVYPSINNGIFTVQPGWEETLISVINMQGQLIFNQTSNERITIDISSSPAGKYFVVLNENNKIYTRAIEILK